MRVVLVACLLALGAVAPAAQADPQRPGQAERFMRVYGAAAPPFGFVQFCDRAPDECTGIATGTGATLLKARFDTTPQRLSELDEINRLINARIRPETDQDLYGMREYWTLPVDAGDCEDYALLKRRMLIERGWPVGSLLMTVVRDERGDGHAVLTARTSLGDFVLDNKIDEVRLWSQTGYRFVMRQSYVDPRLWMSLAPTQTDRDQMLTSNPSHRR